MSMLESLFWINPSFISQCYPVQSTALHAPELFGGGDEEEDRGIDDKGTKIGHLCIWSSLL